MKTKKRLCDRCTNNIMLHKSTIIVFAFLFVLCLVVPESAVTNPLIKIESIEAGLSTTASFSITTESIPLEMGGFDFLINYYPLAMSPSVCSMGQLLTDCEWEYYTYQYLASDMLRLRAIADINNGDFHPNCYGPPDSDPHELLQLSFTIASDEWWEGVFMPLYFYWTDCGDNVISSIDGDTLFVSDHVYDFEGVEITDSTLGFPSYFGIQAGCLETAPEDPIKIRAVDFMDGGVLIYGDWLCGDPNRDWAINIFDVTMIISYLYMDGPAPVPLISADVNNDSLVNIFDVTSLISYLYLDGSAPECP